MTKSELINRLAGNAALVFTQTRGGGRLMAGGVTTRCTVARR